ncbi:reverse transcriptase domain-containing protein [Tanacetum coccineum]
MKLNPKKCTFGIEEGMLLGYKVSTKGIKLASLNRFLSKSAEKSLPFFKTLKKCTKKSDFQWTAEAEVAFKQMKKLIAELPAITASMEKEEMIVYLTAAREAVSAVLMTEREAKQMPVYFVSHALQDGSGAGLVLANLEGTEFTYALRFRFDATNNEAEYETLIAGLRIAEQMGVKNLQTNVDSRLVANQVLVEELNEKSIHEAKVLADVEEEGDTRMTPIYNYLTEETLPAEKEMARAIRRKSGWFGLQGEIISDNGKQFRDNLFKDWCEKLCIRQCFASVKHPQANGLVERENRSLGEGIKAGLNERSKDWIEELPHVLWVHRTMIKSSNEDTPFSLTYGIEAVIPAEIGMPTMRTMKVDMVQNDEAL